MRALIAGFPQTTFFAFCANYAQNSQTYADPRLAIILAAMAQTISPNRHFVNLGRMNYLGQPMLQRVCRCGPVPRAVIHNSKPRSR